MQYVTNRTHTGNPEKYTHTRARNMLVGYNERREGPKGLFSTRKIGPGPPKSVVLACLSTKCPDFGVPLVLKTKISPAFVGNQRRPGVCCEP